MKKYSGIVLGLFGLISFFSPALRAQNQLDSLLPVRGFCIAAPAPSTVDSFVVFIRKELAPRHVNTLILRVDYNYQFTSHPELRDADALSAADARKIVDACHQLHIRIIPQINLLGHQSWASQPNKLLQVYPEFDETPWVKMPEKYAWPNDDNLYCKSYCPLHPGVHKVVFDLIDEICDVFQADAFHAGMDEVFYLGEANCPRCGGRDKAALFAGEVRAIHDHLAQKGRQLWIWGDRLLDGKTTGLGMWEASYNNTYRAIDMIPKDVMICDWHYDRPDKTAVYFAMKGFDVVTCPFRKPAVAVAELRDMLDFRQESTPEMKVHFKGMAQTIWSGVSGFLDGYYGKTTAPKDPENTTWQCFRTLFDKIDQLD